MNRNKFIEKARNIHGYKYNYIDIPDKITHKDYIEIEYNGTTYKQRVSKHLMGKCCEKNNDKKTTDEFISESKKVWGDRFDYNGFEYNGSKNKIILYDKHLDRYTNQLPSAHLRGHECKSIKNEDFIKISEIVSDYRYDYTECEYKSMIEKVKLICNDHGPFYIKPFNHINYGEVCPKCVSTKFRKKVIKFLNNNKIDSHLQYRFKDTNFSFDFFIFSMRTVIDFTYDDTDEIKQNDSIKTQYCEENYIDLIRIKYTQVDDIENILSKNLKHHIKRLFNLNI